MFDIPPRSNAGSGDEGAAPDPVALDLLDLRWQMLVGRDRRPTGVRLELRNRRPGAGAPLSALLDGVVRGFVANETTPFPQGLVLLAPVGAEMDAAMARWTAPRNVLLEVPVADLADEARARVLFESRGRGVRQALRLQDAAAAPERLQFFQYLVGPSSVARLANIPLLALDSQTHAVAEAALAAGAHALVGWPLVDRVTQAKREITPSQKAIFELVRLIQADADMRALEKVFEAEPLLAYMLLTLANSVAFRRGAATASLRQAVANIGYQRLVKWLVLILAISSKDSGLAPAIFTTIVRGYCMENLCAAAGRPRNEIDESFIVGAFSLLDTITGVPLDALFAEVGLPQQVVDAVLRRQGPYAVYFDMVLALEAGNEAAGAVDAGPTSLEPDAINRSLLQAIAAADAMLALI